MRSPGGVGSNHDFNSCCVSSVPTRSDDLRIVAIELRGAFNKFFTEACTYCTGYRIGMTVQNLAISKPLRSTQLVIPIQPIVNQLNQKFDFLTSLPAFCLSQEFRDDLSESTMATTSRWTWIPPPWAISCKEGQTRLSRELNKPGLRDCPCDMLRFLFRLPSWREIVCPRPPRYDT